MKYLRPAVRHGDFEVWTDRELEGGAKWEEKIELNLRACDIFMLLRTSEGPRDVGRYSNRG